MRLVIKNSCPSMVVIEDFQDPLDSIKESLSYRDSGAVYLLTKFKKNKKLIEWMGEDAYLEKLGQLAKAAEKKCLLTTVDGVTTTYAGLAPYLAAKLHIPVINEVEYPAFKKLAWANELEFPPYPYQVESTEALLFAKHGGVSLSTGLGKSYIIQMVVREIGLKTVIMTPSTSISKQLYKACVHSFGLAKVGMYFGGKKQANKHIVIANAQSLTKIELGSADWTELSKAKVFAVDESHTIAANTFEKVASGIARTAPYRFFFSATQIRNDGRDLMLEGIIGPLVKSMSLKEGVDGGYLSKPTFMMLRADSDDSTASDDVNKMTRKHLFYNTKVAQTIGSFANQSLAQGKPILILIEEVEQFTKLLPYLNTVQANIGFAHGPLADNKDKVPKEYWESDNEQLVNDFNSGKLPILVGTSCISTGTDVKSTKVLVYWQGGKSEVQVTQAIGRGTRITPTKNSFLVIDFSIENIPILKKHADARAAIYNALYGPVKYKEV